MDVKYIGKGAYGCVFMPALSCEGQVRSKRKDATDVGKLFRNPRDFSDEMKAYKIIKALDPKSEWSLPIKKACKANIHEVNDSLLKCPFIQEDVGTGERIEYMQIVMPYGGIPLRLLFRGRHPQQSLYAKPSIKDLTAFMKTVLKGISKIDQAGYVHMDVKPANILLRKKGKAATQAYLIDFSLLQKKTGVYDYRTNQFIFRTKYVWYPPEFTIFYKLKKTHQSVRSFARTLDMKENEKQQAEQDSDAPYRQSKSASVSTASIISKCLHVFDFPSLGLSGKALYQKQSKQLREFLVHLSSSKGSVQSIFDGFVDKIDVYSTGVTFLNIIQYYYKDAKGIEALTSVLERMVAADPRRRYSIAQALDAIEALSV